MTRYDDLPGVRRSDLWLINKSPEHFYYFTHNRPEPTPSLIFGQAAHKYILERDHFDEEFAIRPDVDRRTKAGKEAWYQFAMDCNDNDLTYLPGGLRHDQADALGYRGASDRLSAAAGREVLDMDGSYDRRAVQGPDRCDR